MNPIIIVISVALFASSVVGDYDYYCPIPEVPNDGYIVKGKQNNYEVGSVVYYACNHGYKLWGESKSKCVSKNYDEYWDSDPPECRKDGCEDLKAPQYGYVKHRGTEVGTVATYSCKHGYNVAGDEQRECQYDGTWSGKEPQCKLVDCGSLHNPLYGKVAHPGTYFGAKATYTCDDGYELVGNHVRRCKHDGYWSHTEPVCKKIGCGDLQDLEYGKVEHEDTHVGSIATYTCEYGYKLVGESERQCEYTGYWSGTEPECIKIQCEALQDLDYGKVEYEEMYVGSIATYSCEYGYKLVGVSERECEYTGYWSGTKPECIKIQCEALQDLDYGKVEYEEMYVGAIATYTCDYGYKLVGKNERQCEHTGYWSGTEPECIKIQCEALQDLDYGKVEYEEMYVGSIATYSCDYGYKLVGESERQCEYSGYWSGTKPECIKIQCEALKDLEYGKVEYEEMYVGSIATYSCDYGYKLEGNSERECEHSGYWSYKEPVCKKIQCENLQDLDYGKVEYKETYVGSIAIYSCDYGYKLEGNSKRECEYSGYWSGTKPECIKIQCKDLLSPDYGRVEHEGTHVGAKATYTCNDGYRLVGSHKRSCQNNGHWSGNKPICKKSGCKNLQAPDYGQVKYEGTHVGARAIYSCDDGYKLEGYRARTCTNNGYWSRKAPICKKIGCESLQDPDYGRVVHEGTNVEAIATYTCDDGYKLVGHRSRKCKQNGYWSGKEPECKKGGCEDLENLEYGEIELEGTHVGAKATYTCDDGYKLVGYRVRSCQYNGYWSGKKPECKKSGCEDLENPDYGEVELEGTHVGAKATYTCDDGYKLVGYGVRTCQHNGYWSGREPKCQPHKDCEKPEEPNYGSIHMSGSYAIYSCDEGYKRVGRHYRVCQNSYWVGDAPHCVKRNQE